MKDEIKKYLKSCKPSSPETTKHQGKFALSVTSPKIPNPQLTSIFSESRKAHAAKFIIQILVNVDFSITKKIV